MHCSKVGSDIGTTRPGSGIASQRSEGIDSGSAVHAVSLKADRLRCELVSGATASTRQVEPSRSSTTSCSHTCGGSPSNTKETLKQNLA